MKHRKMALATLSALAVGAMLLSDSPAGAGEVVNWTLTGCDSPQVSSGGKCKLKNQGNQQCLVPDNKAGRTDWAFGQCDTPVVSFVSKSGAAPKCGEPLALKIGTEFFRKCVNPQLVGINICSEAVAAPQDSIGGTAATHWDWKITGCTPGAPVAMNQPFSLVNIARNDSIVYARRGNRITDTCWSSDARLGVCTSVRDR